MERIRKLPFAMIFTVWKQTEEKNTQLIQNVHTEITRDFLIRYGQIVDKLNSENDEIKLKMMFVWVRKKTACHAAGRKYWLTRL